MLITRDGYERHLTDAVIRPDSIVGMGTDSLQGQRIAVAQQDVVRVESREHDPAPALGAAGGFLANMAGEFGRLVGTLFRCLLLRC
jgi:hypothetical protein